MSTQNKLPPHEAWNRLQDMAIEDEVDRVASLSDTELDAELAGQGIDPKALRARGAALAAKLGAKEPAASVEHVSRPQPLLARRWVATLAAASLVVAGVVAIPVAQRLGIGPADDVASAPSGPVRAAAMRREAGVACGERRWVECRHRLDEAKALDPKGEESPEVRRWRSAIADAIGQPLPP